MTKTSHFYTGFIAAAALGICLSVSLPSGQALALTCKNHSVTHPNWAFSATTYSLAKKRARVKWRASVRVTPGLGWAWSDWGKAKNKRYDCKKAGVWGNSRKCKAIAQPCK